MDTGIFTKKSAKLDFELLRFPGIDLIAHSVQFSSVPFIITIKCLQEHYSNGLHEASWPELVLIVCLYESLLKFRYF